MSFGHQLKKLRKNNKMTREELGTRLGMSYSTIAKYETNNRFPDQETLIKIADIFDVTVDYLLRNNKPHELPETVAPYLPEGFDELPPEAKKEVLNYLDYIIVKYGKKEDKDKH